MRVWPRYYPAGLAAWLVGLPVAAVLVQVASGYALGSEQGPMFRLESALLVFLGSACFLTGFIHSGDKVSRGTWMLAGFVAFLMIAAELNSVPLFGGADYDSVDVAGLVLTAAVLAFMTRFERPPAAITNLLALGFALQSAAIVVDVSDGGYFDVSPAQALVMGSLDEILDLVTVVVYCAAFFAMLVHVRMEATSDDTPGATIHRLARIAQWHRPLRSIGRSLQWALVVVPTTAVRFTWRNGSVTAQRTGRSLLLQVGDQLRLAFLYGIPPSHYYVFELFEASSRSRAHEYLLRSETKGFAYAVLRERPISPLKDKLAFFRRCEAYGLSAVPVVLALDGKGQLLAPAFGPPTLPSVDLFIKPNPGKGGRGPERWDCVGNDRYRRFGGEVVSASVLFGRLQQAPFASGCIVQPRMMPHKALADLSTGALPTIRVVTCRTRDGDVEVTNAVLRMAQRRDTIVDNFHAGGIAAAVDVASGRLGSATDLGRDQSLGWVDCHPETKAKIAGRMLPLWPETIELARRAHREAFADRVVVGWDIAILDAGPMLVEGNSSPDLDIVQRTHRRPLGSELLGVLLASALRSADTPALRVLRSARAFGAPRHTCPPV